MLWASYIGPEMDFLYRQKIVSYLSMKRYVVGKLQNHLAEVLLMSTHICSAMNVIYTSR